MIRYLLALARDILSAVMETVERRDRPLPDPEERCAACQYWCERARFDDSRDDSRYVACDCMCHTVRWAPDGHPVRVLPEESL